MLSSVPARMRHDQEQHEQPEKNSRQCEDQQHAIGKSPMALRIGYQAADHDGGDAAQYPQPEHDVKRRDRSVGETDHEEVQRDERDDGIDRDEYAEKYHERRLAGD